MKRFKVGFIGAGNIATAIWKNSKTEQVSDTVVISGAAIIAGSSFNFLASIGRIPPSSFAKITVPINVNDTVNAICGSWY